MKRTYIAIIAVTFAFIGCGGGGAETETGSAPADEQSDPVFGDKGDNATGGGKTLTANCKADDGKSLDLVSKVQNVNTPQEIQSLVIDGEEMSVFRDISEMPIYKSGDWAMKLQFGERYYSSAEISLSKCHDSFEATGKAFVKYYVGGFAGTSLSEMTCTCSLQ